MSIQLRDYQATAVSALRASYQRGARAPLFVLPTGGGKTFVFTYIAQQAAVRNSRVLILVHRQELLRQASDSLDFLEVDHGLVAPGHTPTDDLVQVASVQTLVRRLHRHGSPPDLIIVDEAHHAVAGSWRKSIGAFPAARVLGVTATPSRLDGRGLGQQAGGVFDDMVIGPSVADLIASGHLSQPVCYAPPSQLDLVGVHKRGGDYARGEVAARVDKPTITGDAVKHYQRLCGGRPALAFCASVAHAEHVAVEFRRCGIRSASLDGSMPDDERKAAIADLGTGVLQVLTSCDIVSEGFDLPVVSAAILLRPTASTSLYLQQVGRALRPYPGKDRAVILDHVGNVCTHGLPDEDRDWSLDGLAHGSSGEGGPTGPAMRQCERCYACHSPAPACPQCGFFYKVEDDLPEQVDGELEEITPEQAERMKRDRKREEWSCSSLEDFERLGAARGYKPGWAAHRWGARRTRRGATG